MNNNMKILQTMKKYFILILTLYIAIGNLRAQDSELDAWRKQKTEEYDKWKRMRAEIAGILPNVYQDSVSDFINQGFIVTTKISVDKLIKSNMKVWVVAVGIAAYADTEGLQPLQYADDDARMMYEFYRTPEGGSIPDSQIELLIDEAATRPNILNAINRIYAGANANDAIIFYFSGHGGKKAFATHEYNSNIRNNNGLLLHRELLEIFKKSKARYKYLIADACHAGGLAKIEEVQTGTVSKGTFYEAFEGMKEGFAMLLSCKDNEESVELDTGIHGEVIRHGIFTYYLLEGLKGKCDVNKDRVISVSELFEYVSNGVRKYTEDFQIPILSGKNYDTLPIAIVRK
jgi:uncharacterized caspase-like protein